MHLAGGTPQQHRHPVSTTTSTTCSAWTSSTRPAPPPTSRPRSAVCGLSASADARCRCRSNKTSWPWLTTSRPSAAAIRAVNTIVNDDGVLTAVQHRLHRRGAADQPSTASTRRAGVLIRGSGGMAGAVATAFRDNGFSDGRHRRPQREDRSGTRGAARLPAGPRMSATARHPVM